MPAPGSSVGAGLLQQAEGESRHDQRAAHQQRPQQPGLPVALFWCRRQCLFARKHLHRAERGIGRLPIVSERLDAPDCANGFILDGFPRTLVQADATEVMLKGKGIELSAVIEIEVDDKILADRVSGRYTCANCGAGYHDTNVKPKVEGVCDRCGSTHFKRRPDDNRETVVTRLAAYYKETSPLIGYYHAKGKLKVVDGMADIDHVTAEIDAILSKL